MKTTCDTCVWADWKRTKAGRLHPDKTGRCLYVSAHPLDIRLPAAFWWNGLPAPYGGYIERGAPHKAPCLFWEAAP